MGTARFNNVLLIDDNEINNVMHERLIEMSGFAGSLVVKQSAVDALEYLNTEVKDETNAPELIFLDIRMPIMDGFGFLAEYENLPDYITKKAKVVMLTSSLDEEDNEKAKLNPHVISFLVKPLSIDKLKSLEV